MGFVMVGTMVDRTAERMGSMGGLLVVKLVLQVATLVSITAIWTVVTLVATMAAM